jgi:hypothetical protein
MENRSEKDEMKGVKDDERILPFRPNTALLAQHRTTLQCPQPTSHIYIYIYIYLKLRPRAF